MNDNEEQETAYTGGNSHMKGKGMPLVSFRDANHGLWFHLRCSGRHNSISSRQGIFLGFHMKNKKKICHTFLAV